VEAYQKWTNPLLNDKLCQPYWRVTLNREDIMGTKKETDTTIPVEEYVRQFRERGWCQLEDRDDDGDTAARKWFDRICDPNLTYEEATHLLGLAFLGERDRNKSIVRFLMGIARFPDIAHGEYNNAGDLSGSLQEWAYGVLVDAEFLWQSNDKENEDWSLDREIIAFLRTRFDRRREKAVRKVVRRYLEFDAGNSGDESDARRYENITTMVPSLLVLAVLNGKPKKSGLWPDAKYMNSERFGHIYEARQTAIVKALEAIVFGNGRVVRSQIATGTIPNEYTWAVQELMLYYPRRAKEIRERLDGFANELSMNARQEYKNGKPLSEIITTLKVGDKEINLKALEDELAQLPTFR